MESHQDEKKRNLDPGSEVHPQYSGASPHAIPRSLAESVYNFFPLFFSNEKLYFMQKKKGTIR
jgi:hypothetical protein